MQLTSYSVLSFLLVAATATVQASPSPYSNGRLHDISARSGLHAPLVGRHLHQRRSPHLAPGTLLKKSTNSTEITQKKCRLRPTSSSSSDVLPTGTVAGANTTRPHAHHSSATQNATNSMPFTSSTAAATPTATQANFSNQWRLDHSHQGHSFFDGWTFWNDADPTHGTVNFLDYQDALDGGLLQFNDGQPAVMRVGTQDNVGNRDSIRIQDTYTFNINTLLLMDAQHMPTGCGAWPAWWANGPNWPYGGEIDILEGVNDQQQNQATLHTADGCTVESDPNHPSTGQVLNPDCGVVGGDNTGCGFLDTDSDNSYGYDFNSNGGGVYAMQWVASGVSIWFFPRGNIPADIAAEQPMPWTWKAPFAHWSASGCNPYQFFNDMTAIFDTTFCGDWASAAWGSSGCADKTGVSTCEAYVQGTGSNFADTYWAVNYVKYFIQNT